MNERKSHYAACHDCPLYKWVTSQERADEAARAHEEKYPGHDAFTGLWTCPSPGWTFGHERKLPLHGVWPGKRQSRASACLHRREASGLGSIQLIAAGSTRTGPCPYADGVHRDHGSGAKMMVYETLINPTLWVFVTALAIGAAGIALGMRAYRYYRKA